MRPILRLKWSPRTCVAPHTPHRNTRAFPHATDPAAAAPALPDPRPAGRSAGLHVRLRAVAGAERRPGAPAGGLRAQGGLCKPPGPGRGRHRDSAQLHVLRGKAWQLGSALRVGGQTVERIGWHSLQAHGCMAVRLPWELPDFRVQVHNLPTRGWHPVEGRCAMSRSGGH